MKKYVFLFLAVISMNVYFLAADDLTAVIEEVAGKVEFQHPGGEWLPAEPGVALTIGSMISTGFKSSAILKIASATITVKPVTRLTLEELIKTEGTTQTQMFLMAGRVQAEVSPADGEAADFKVKSPTATASVRGTGFEFDGQNLVVQHGAVAFNSDIGTSYLVAAGQFSTLNEQGVSVPPVTVGQGQLDTSLRSHLSTLQAQVDNPPPPLEKKIGAIELYDDNTVSISVDWED